MVITILTIEKKEDYVEHITNHMIELRDRLKTILIFNAILFSLLYPFSTNIINKLWNIFFWNNTNIFVYTPATIIYTKIKIISLICITFTIPLIIYELLSFISRGLKKNEYYFIIKLIPFSLLLFLISIYISCKFLIPLFIKYVLLYSNNIATPQIDFITTLDTIVTMIIWLCILFQVPLVLIFSMKMKIIKKEKIYKLRLPIYFSVFSIAFLTAPNISFISNLIITLIFILLFESCILIERYL